MGFINRHRRPASYSLFGKPKKSNTKKAEAPSSTGSSGTRPGLLVMVVFAVIAVILIVIFSGNTPPKVMRDKTLGEMSASEYATYLQEEKQGVTLRFSDPAEKARYIRESKEVMGNLRGAEYRLNDISSNESTKARQERYENALEAVKEFNKNYRPLVEAH